MKLVIAGAAAAAWCLALLCPSLASAQPADSAQTPALRGGEETAAPAAEPAGPNDAAQATITSGVDTAAAPAAQAEAGAVETAEAETEGAEDRPAAASQAAATLSPAQLLAEARSAALAAAAIPGAIADPLISRAADYVLFQRDLAAVESRRIEEPDDLDAVMDTLASYNAQVLNDAWLSYGAFIAAQNPVFVDKVREVAAYYGESQLIQGMINEPEYVMGFDGARDAAARVLGVMREDAARITALSDRFKQESYDLQKRGWSNMIARDRPARLGGLNAPQRITTAPQDLLARVAYGAPITSEESAEIAAQRRIAFWEAVEYRDEPPAVAATQAPSAEALGVMMTLAAMRALDATAERPDLVSHLLNLPGSKQCLDFSLLHLRQCVAAAHFKYEDAFCIAEHQLLDAGECMTDILAAGWVRPRAPATPVPAAAALTTAGVPDADAAAETTDTASVGPAAYPSLTPATALADQAAAAAEPNSP